MKKTDIKYWLALLRTPRLGPIIAREILTKITIKELFSAKSEALTKLGVPQNVASNITNTQWQLIEQDLDWLNESNHHLITCFDMDYPPLLKEIQNPPLALYVEGDPHILFTPQLAIVGSRNPSYIGKSIAFDFSKCMSQSGLTITSGFALGIDTAAHTGALAKNGRTVAVMGTGLDRLYPTQNRELAEKIIENGGALVSEFPIGTPIKAGNFPYRNRIVSGLSVGTLVVEATIRSGSLITARLATEQGREVFAIPGSIHNPLARGCHQLIRQGAKLIETAKDIIEELGPLAAKTGNHAIINCKNEHNQKENQATLDSDYHKLLEYIGYEVTAIDLLVTKSGLPANEIASMLLILELQGHITTVSGGYARIKSPG